MYPGYAIATVTPFVPTSDSASRLSEFRSNRVLAEAAGQLTATADVLTGRRGSSWLVKPIRTMTRSLEDLTTVLSSAALVVRMHPADCLRRPKTHITLGTGNLTDLRALKEFG